VTPPLDAYLAARPVNTARSYRRSITSWLDWLGKEPAHATQRDARQWAATLAACYRPASTAAKLSACASFHSWLVEQGLARANPFDGAQRPTVPHYANSTVLTVAEVRRLNSYLDAPPLRVLDPADLPPSRLRDRALVGFLLATGRWPSEIAGLRWSNLLNDGDLWTLEDHQVIPARSVRNIEDWHRAEDWIIRPGAYLWRRRQTYNNLPTVGPLDPDGHITPCQIAAIVRKVGKRAGIPDLSPGALRNTFAALHLATTGDMDTTARALGHTDTTTLGRLVDSPRGAAAMREFGAVLDALR